MPAVRIISKIYPKDYNKNYGSLAIKLPTNSFSPDSNSEVFNMSTTTEEQAISNFVNLLLTKNGERFMQPRFGIGLQYYIFEPNTIDIATKLKQNIKNQVDIWLPYILINSIEVRNTEDGMVEIGHAMNIIINFKVTENGANSLVTLSPAGPSTVNVEILNVK